MSRMRPTQKLNTTVAPRIRRKTARFIGVISLGLLGVTATVVFRDYERLPGEAPVIDSFFDEITFSSGAGFEADTVNVGEHKRIQLITNYDSQRFNVVMDRLHYEEVQIRLYNDKRELAKKMLFEHTTPWQTFVIDHNRMADGSYYLIVDLNRYSEVIEPIFLN
ncbi:MAG: hypothetical protein AAF655_07190 [Bacteroidota bacterium]